MVSPWRISWLLWPILPGLIPRYLWSTLSTSPVVQGVPIGI